MKKNLDVRNLLYKVGITPDSRGYFYLLDGISMVKKSFQQGKPVESYCNLYMDIAKIHGSLNTRVERCIRHDIIKAFADPTPTMSELFGNGKKPTNSAFMSILAERLMLESEG